MGGPQRSKTEMEDSFSCVQTRNRTESEALLRERETFGDLIDLIRAVYYEHYWNQTLKILMAFQCAFLCCNFPFLLKMVDDTFVDIQSLISLLAKSAIPRTKLYMGEENGKFGLKNIPLFL